MFETGRLRVRRLEDGDLEAMMAVYGDADAMRWVGDGRALTRDEGVAWLAVTARNVATRGYGMSTIVERGSGRVVGFCGLVHPGGQPEAEIKYALRRDCWGRGYATEAAIGLLAWGARQCGLRRVIATAATGNAASHRVLRKAGLVEAATRRNPDGSSTLVFVWNVTPSPV